MSVVEPMTSIDGFREEPEVTSELHSQHAFYSGWLVDERRIDEGARALPPTTRLQLGLLATLFALLLIDVPQNVEGKRGGVRIPDDLSDVPDADEDASWRAWGEGIKSHPKIKPLDPEKKQDGDFKTMAMCVVTLSVSALKERRWTLDGCV